jgi:hypothetical protein
MPQTVTINHHIKLTISEQGQIIKEEYERRGGLGGKEKG